MTKLTWLALFCAGCTTEGSLGHGGPSSSRQQVALVPFESSNKIDLLFVIDNSPSTLGFKSLLDASLPEFFNTLQGGSAGKPDFQIGVVTTDLGSTSSGDDAPGPWIGTGPGECRELGDDATMVSGAMFTGAYITETNHAGTLSDAFQSILSIGSDGCGFEQPLRAAELALSRPANDGFVRDDANLAIVVASTEDDCSLASTSLLGSDPALGPLHSFRCTRFGVTCDQGGETSDAMNEVGPKSGCHANKTDGLLADVLDMASSIRATKLDPRQIFFGALAVPSTTVQVDLRIPPDGGAAIPMLDHACPAGESALDPAVRISDMATQFHRSHVVSPCSADLAEPMQELARDVRGMTGDTCLTRDIAMPEDCEAFDTHLNGQDEQLPACDGSLDRDCFALAHDASCSNQGLRLVVNRIGAPPVDTMVALRCKI
jgi:hypothetical protein